MKVLSRRQTGVPNALAVSFLLSAFRPSSGYASDDFAQAIVETLHEPLIVLSPDLVVQSANHAFYKQFEVDPEGTIGRRIYDLGNGQWDIPALRRLLEEVLPDNSVFNGFEVEHRFQSIGHRIMLVNARRLNHSQLILLGIHDVTAQTRAQRELRTSRHHLASIYASAKVGISEVSSDGRFVTVNDELCRILGRSSDEIGQLTIRDVTHPDDLPRTMAKINELFETGNPISIDKRYVRPDGSVVHANSTGSLLEGSEAPSIVMVTTDLTGRRKAEMALRASEARLRALVTATSDVVYRMSPDWRHMHFLESKTFLEELHGTGDASEATPTDDGQSWIERYIPEDERPAVLAAIAKAQADRGVFEFEHRVKRRDGSIGWTHSRAVPLMGEDGQILEWFGAATDVTARKEAEQAVRHSEARMRLLTDSLPVLISYVDADQCYRFNNHTYEQWFGASAADMAGKHMRDVLGESAYRTVRPHVEKALGGEVATFEAKLDYTGAGTRDVAVVYVPDLDEGGSARGMFALITDMTERRRAEQALRESEQRYRTLFNSIDEGFCVIEMIHDARGRPVDYAFLTVNPAFETHTGIKNAVGRSMREIAPEHEQQWFDAYDQIARSGKSQRFQMPAQALGRYYDVYAFPIGEPGHKRLGVLFRDVQEQRSAEEALRLSEQRYRMLVESAREYAMLMIDPDGVVVSWSVGAERLFGYTAKEMIGQPSETLYTEDDRAAGTARRKRERALTEGQVSTDQWYRRKDGSLFWANGVLRPLDGHPRGFVKILRDQTRQKAHDEQLKIVMAELNHRVKNTLAVVQSIASQTMRRASSLEAFRPDFEKRLRSIAKAHNLLTRTSWTGVTLGRVIESEVGVAPADVRITSHGPDVTLSPEMTLALHMVLHELTTNARKYGCLSSDTGALSIEWTVQGDGPDRTLEIIWTECCPRPVAGPGADGFGTRLIEQLVVYELKGHVERTFQPEGLRIRVRVPLAAATPVFAAEPTSAVASAAAPRAGSQSDRPTVLLVEDLAPLAMAMKDELEYRGFIVLGPASTVAQAKAIAHETPPSVAILDVNLGDEQVYPLIPILEAAGVAIVLLTGHEPSSLPEAVRHVPVLPKPVEMDELERFIRANCG
jgi:PAS domain S-box-containing protein